MKISTITRSLVAIGALLCMQTAYAQEITAVKIDSPTVVADATAGARAKFSLSDSQLEKLRSLKDQLSLDTAEKKAQLKVDQHQLFDLLSKSTVDKNAVLALQSKINGLRTDLSNARLNFMLAANDVFTAEQKEAMRHRMLKRSVVGKFSCGRGGHCGGKFGKYKGMKHRSFERGKVTQAPAVESQNS